MAAQHQKRPNVYLKEFIREFAENAGITEVNAEFLTGKFLETIKETLLDNQSICFPEFGVFELRETAERNGCNFSTMESCTIPAGSRILFRPSKSLKAYLSKAMQETALEDADSDA